MKITAKTTKEQLKQFLGANVSAVKKQDKDLFDRIAYADKMAKTDDSKVTRKDLVDLAKEVITLLGDAMVVPTVTPVAENSVKKLAKGVSKKQETKTEVPEVENSEETAEEKQEESVDQKKSAKKSLGKKKEQPKKDGVTVLETTKNEKAVQLAEAFPKTLTVGDTNYELATDIKTMEDLYNALGSDDEIVFAYYWTKRHLKQFPYFDDALGHPKSFDNDLDLATCIYVSDEKKIAYHVSMYTEAIYNTLPTDLEEVDGVRYARGIEYQIYRAVK